MWRPDLARYAAPMTIEPPPSLAAAPEIDRRRVLEQIEEQRTLFVERTPGSGTYYERARRVMPKGVPSSFQENDPWPVYIERGTGAQVWDVDGNEYLDFHNGFGVMCVGHANPAAVKRRVDEGTHFAAPTEGSIRDDLTGRGHRTVRSRAGRRDARQGDLRRAPRRGDRHDP
jgi:Aminotransferase class-III